MRLSLKQAHTETKLRGYVNLLVPSDCPACQPSIDRL